MRLCETGGISQCRYHSSIYDCTWGDQATDRGALSWSMSARPSGGRKRNEENLMVRKSTSYMVSPPTNQACLKVWWYYDCTRPLTYSVLIPYEQACTLQNTRRKCLDCVCWYNCYNRKTAIQFTNMARILLGHFD